MVLPHKRFLNQKVPTNPKYLLPMSSAILPPLLHHVASSFCFVPSLPLNTHSEEDACNSEDFDVVSLLVESPWTFAFGELFLCVYRA